MQFGLSRKLNNLRQRHLAVLLNVVTMTPNEREAFRMRCAHDYLKLLLPYRVFRWYYRSTSQTATPADVANEAMQYVDELFKYATANPINNITNP